MACLAVWIRNIALRWGPSAMSAVRSGGCDGIRRLPINVTTISVATSGTDFTGREADFAALQGCWLLSWEITFVTWELQELGQRLVRTWRKAAVHTQTASRD